MEEELTLSVEDTHVSRFRLPDIKEAKTIHDISGQNILDSLENCIRITRLERTWADIFDSVWIPYSKTWTVKTTPLGALVLKQRVSVPPTAGNGSSGSLIGTPTEAMSIRSKRFRKGRVPNPMELAMIGQEKLWATPSAMDHLPQRSAEATLRLQEGQRKGRSRPSNLREQVDPETMKMYPTPEANERNAFPRWTKTRKGKQKLEPNLAGIVKMWPTPTVGCVEGGEQSGRVERTESGGYILRKKNKPEMTYGAKLSDAILFEEKQNPQQQMWPTPTTQEIEHPQAELTATGRRKTKDGTNSHSLNLADTVQQMLPTPTERDWKGGHGTLVKKNGKYYRVSNTTGTRFGARLDAVVEKEAMMPTPTSRDWKSGEASEATHQRNARPLNEKVIRENKAQQKQSEIKLHLNPTWVEALMGFPPGWTVLGNEESQE